MSEKWVFICNNSASKAVKYKPTKSQWILCASIIRVLRTAIHFFLLLFVRITVWLQQPYGASTTISASIKTTVRQSVSSFHWAQFAKETQSLAFITHRIPSIALSLNHRLEFDYRTRNIFALDSTRIWGTHDRSTTSGISPGQLMLILRPRNGNNRRMKKTHVNLSNWPT